MSCEVYKSPLHKTVCISSTDLWNDSCSVEELAYAIENGAVGATTNPVIVTGVLKKELHIWDARIKEIIKEMPDCTEEDIAWRLNEEMAIKGASLLKDIFDRENGKKGRLSIQTNPKYYRCKELIVKQALHLSGLAPNIHVKIPATKAGIEAIEEVTYLGVNANATVCFSVPQAVAVAEAFERGLEKRLKEGKDISSINPVCSMMIGRLDDWLKVLANKQDIITDPGYLEWAGVAAFKKAYGIFREKGYKTRLLAAAYRNHMHWSELIGGDVILTITHQWQKRFNASDIEVKPRIDNPVNPAIVEELMKKFPDFRRAYNADGMSIDEFDTFGATVRTLREFNKSYDELLNVIREYLLPNPDIK